MVCLQLIFRKHQAASTCPIQCVFYLVSLGFTSLPLWYHFTLASGLSTLQLNFTFRFVFPFRSFKPFAIPYSGSAAESRVLLIQVTTTTRRLTYVQLRGSLCTRDRCTLSLCKCNVHRLPSGGSWSSACTCRSPRPCPSRTLDPCSTPVIGSELVCGKNNPVLMFILDMQTKTEMILLTIWTNGIHYC